MKKINYFLMAFIILQGVSNSVCSQVVIADPELPLVKDSIAITFYVDSCDCSLEGYTGDIYAYTGLITAESVDLTDWKYEVANWGNNLEKTKLEKISNSVHVLHITPDLSNYYGTPQDESVEKIALVFRSEDATSKSKDIFVDVYDSGINLEITLPEHNLVVPEGALITVAAEAELLNTSAIDSFTLYIDDVALHTSYSDTLLHQISATGTGMHWIKVAAQNDDFLTIDSLYYFIRDEISETELPAGIRDGVTIVDTNMATFTFYAPNKESVMLIGDFNDWKLSAEYLMNRTPDSNRYWITVDSLNPAEEYAFQYLIDGHINVADPYTEKVLDPDHDSFIPDETYPDLKAYPEGKTTGIVAVMQTRKEAFPWQEIYFVPAANEDLVIYELHVQGFTEKGTLSALMDTLDYFADLGANAIELMPINEFGGNQSWGYNPSFYFALDKIYGTPYDLKSLVNACHKKGLAVIIDMVLNHTTSASPMVQMYWNADSVRPAADNPWYNEEHNFIDNTAAHWDYDFNHDSEATRAFIDSVNSYWMTEYMIDGFRFDFTKGFSNTEWHGSENWGSSYDASRITNLKRMSDEIWKRNDGAIVMFEHLSDNSEETELANHGIMLWGNGNYVANEATMGYNEGGKSDFNWGSYIYRGWSEPHLVVYMESHDEERLMYKNQRWGNETTVYSTRELRVALQRAEAAAAFVLSIPGPKMIWQWGELGYDYSINRCSDGSVDDDGGCRLVPKPLGWDFYSEPMRYRLHEVYKALIEFKQMDICRTTDFTLDTYTGLKKIHLNSAEMNAAIVGNFNVEPGEINSAFQHTGTWYDYLTGESIAVSDVSANISLAPGEYHIYTDVLLETPELPVALPGTVNEEYGVVQVFPNPATNHVLVSSSIEGPATFSIYSTTGALLQTESILFENNKEFKISLNAGIGKGVYLYHVTASELSRQGLLLVE